MWIDCFCSWWMWLDKCDTDGRSTVLPITYRWARPQQKVLLLALFPFGFIQRPTLSASQGGCLDAIRRCRTDLAPARRTRLLSSQRQRSSEAFRLKPSCGLDVLRLGSGQRQHNPTSSIGRHATFGLLHFVIVSVPSVRETHPRKTGSLFEYCVCFLFLSRQKKKRKVECAVCLCVCLKCVCVCVCALLRRRAHGAGRATVIAGLPPYYCHVTFQ